MAAAFDVLRWTWTVSGSSYQDKRYLARPPSSTVLAYRDYQATIRRHQALLPNRATSSLHPTCRLFPIEITRLSSSNSISQTSRPSISPIQSCGGLSTIRLLPSGSNQPTNSHSGYLIVLSVAKIMDTMKGLSGSNFAKEHSWWAYGLFVAMVVPSGALAPFFFAENRVVVRREGVGSERLWPS